MARRDYSGVSLRYALERDVSKLERAARSKDPTRAAAAKSQLRHVRTQEGREVKGIKAVNGILHDLEEMGEHYTAYSDYYGKLEEFRKNTPELFKPGETLQLREDVRNLEKGDRDIIKAITERALTEPTLKVPEIQREAVREIKEQLGIDRPTWEDIDKWLHKHADDSAFYDVFQSFGAIYDSGTAGFLAREEVQHVEGRRNQILVNLVDSLPDKTVLYERGLTDVIREYEELTGQHIPTVEERRAAIVDLQKRGVNFSDGWD